MNVPRWLILLLLLVVVAGAGIACGEPAVSLADIPGSGAERGAQLMRLSQLSGRPGCLSCHVLDGEGQDVGPALDGIATVAATQTTGVSAETYLTLALIDPNLHLAEGYNPYAMPTYSNAPEAAISDLVAYMLTLE